MPTLNFKQQNEIKDNFLKFGLKSNPFPMAGIAHREHPYTEISQKVNQDVVEFVDSMTLNKTWQGLVILGDIGTGKTKLLFFIENEINTQLTFANAIYTHDPSPDPIKFIQQIIRSGHIDDLTELIINNSDYYPDFVKIIKKYIRTTVDILGVKKGEIKDAPELITEISKLLVHKIKHDKIRPAYSTLIVDYILKEEFKETEKIDIQLNEEWDLAIEGVKCFLCGEQIPGSKLEYFKIQPYIKIDKTVMETEILPAFLEYNHLAGKEIIFAIIDEFNFITEKYSRARVIETLNIITSLSHSIPNGFCMLLSCTIDSWYVAERISPSFSNRFNRNISMPPLTKDGAIKLTKAYLDYGREKKDKDTIDPFTLESIEKILSYSDFKPREFLKLSGYVLDQFVNVAKSKDSIDIDFTNHSLKKYFEKGKLSQGTLEKWY